jgi:hypothetical protein
VLVIKNEIGGACGTHRKENAHRVLRGKLEESGDLEDLDVNARIILKYKLNRIAEGGRE